VTVTVPAGPSGPTSPSGGWDVVFADGFGLPLINGANNRGRTDVDPAWVFLGNGSDVNGFNNNELQKFNSSQISVASDGLRLTAAYSPNRGTSGGGVCNYVSGAISSTTDALSDGFQFMPGGGDTWAFELVTKWAPQFDGGITSGGNDEGWWASGGPPLGGWKDEIDFIEHWRWRGPPSISAAVWVYDTSGPHTISIPMDMKQILGSDPAGGFHRYTFNLLANNTYRFYVDGELVGTKGPPPSLQRVWMKLILSYALRNPTAPNPRIIPNFQSGTRTWTIQSFVVYKGKDTGDANVGHRTIAPGTIIEGGSTTPTPPSTPSVPTLSASGTTITVRWGSVLGATSYGVYRRLAGATTWTRVTTTSSTTATDIGTAGVSYEYAVTAVNSGGESAKSTAAAITIGTPAPAAPQAPSATIDTSGIIALSWPPVTAATSYGVYRRAAGATTWGSALKTVASTSTTDQPVAGGSYDYAVTARNTGGESAKSTVATVDVPVDPGTLEGPDVEIFAVASEQEGPDIEIFAAATASLPPMTPPTGIIPTAGFEQGNFAWDPFPAAEAITEVHIYVWRLGTSRPAVPQFAGLGTPVASKMTASVTGLVGGATYQWYLAPAREE
jgi:hypothetical protein